MSRGIFIVWYSELRANTIEWSGFNPGTCSVLRKLIQIAISISILLSLLAIAIMLIGHSYPAQSELFNYLSKCDGHPCYLGVVPGKTSWADAVAIFEDAPGMQFDPDINIASNPL